MDKRFVRFISLLVLCSLLLSLMILIYYHHRKHSSFGILKIFFIDCNNSKINCYSNVKNANENLTVHRWPFNLFNSNKFTKPSKLSKFALGESN